MQDIVNTVFGLFRSILRFKWIVLLCACVLSLPGWAYIYQIDERYKVSARVFVDSSNSLFKPSLEGTTGQPDIDEQVNLLSRTLLSRPNLERLARMSDLTVETTTDLEKEKLLDSLAEDVRLKVTRRNTSVYKVTYGNSDLPLAKRMVQSLITIFMENVTGGERKDTQVTKELLDQQNLDQRKEYYEAQLVEAEAKLAAFKQINIGLLPEDREENNRKLDGFKTALLEAQQQLAVAESKLEVYRNQLGQQPVTIVQGGLTASVLESELQELRSELLLLYGQHTEEYRQIVELQIVELRNRVNALEEERAKLNSTGVAENVNVVSVSNPLFEELQAQYTLAEIEVGALKRQVTDNTASIEELEIKLESMPDVARELNQIQRGNESLLNGYHEILDSRESTKLSEQVEQNADSVFFRVIDPPFVSYRPSGPGKEILSAGVFIVAIGAGLMSAFLLNQLSPVFYGTNTVEKRTSRPVLGSVGKPLPWPLIIFKSINWILFLLVAGLLVFIFVIIEVYYMGILPSDRVDAVMHSPIGPLLEKFVSVTASAVEKSKSILGR